MPKQAFLDKFIEKFDRIDKGEILAFISKLSRDKGFLENILNSLNDGVIVLDDKKNIQFINVVACEILGIRDKESVLSKLIDNYIKDIHLYDLIYSEDVLTGQYINREIEISFPRKLVLGTSAMPLLGENSVMSGMAVILRDVTEKRKMEGRMFQSEKLGALTVLAAGLAHEIGNPLNSLHIHVQLIEKEFLKLKSGKKKLEGLIRIVSDEIQRLDDIVRNFLQAIRPLKSKFEEADINDVLEKTIKVIMPELAKNNLKIQKNYSENILLSLMDRSQMKQAFLNIIKNSLQAMPKGGSISVSTSNNTDNLKVIFEDTGEGIAPENLSRIFDPYFTTRKNGIGLGLMMTYRIIKEHGGDVAVKSQIGKGTTFTITLPIRTGMPKMLPKTENINSE